MSTETEHEESGQIVACAIARDIEAFDLLIEDMEAEFGENWGALTFDAAASAHTQPKLIINSAAIIAATDPIKSLNTCK